MVSDSASWPCKSTMAETRRQPRLSKSRLGCTTGKSPRRLVPPTPGFAIPRLLEQKKASFPFDVPAPWSRGCSQGFPLAEPIGRGTGRGFWEGSAGTRVPPLPPVPMPYPFRYRRRELKGSPSGNLTLFLLLGACLWSGASSPVAGIGQPGLHMTTFLG